MNCIFLVFLLLIFFYTNSQTLAEVDFSVEASYTGSVLWTNFVGVSVYYENIENLMNTTLYQGYLINSNLKGQWANNFAVSIKTPLGHKYNCSGLTTNSSSG